MAARPDRYSIVDSCWLKRTEGSTEYYGVIATAGKNARGFDPPVGAWEAEFAYNTLTGSWTAGEFVRR